jgi:galactokinase
MLAEVMAASHLSLKDNYDVSLPAIDQLVDLVAGVLGNAGGVRLTGAGFGGCLVAVLAEDAAPAVNDVLKARYNPAAVLPAHAEIVLPSGGAGPIRMGPGPKVQQTPA